VGGRGLGFAGQKLGLILGLLTLDPFLGTGLDPRAGLGQLRRLDKQRLSWLE
jgi:hypothetical protein